MLRDQRPPGRIVADVVFRFGTGCFAIWVVIVAATSPVAHLRSAWWPAFLTAGIGIALSMLLGAFMTMNFYLRGRYTDSGGDRDHGQDPRPRHQPKSNSVRPDARRGAAARGEPRTHSRPLMGDRRWGVRGTRFV